MIISDKSVAWWWYLPFFKKRNHRSFVYYMLYLQISLEPSVLCFWTTKWSLFNIIPIYCVVFCTIWKLRNFSCFEYRRIMVTFILTYMVDHSFNYWYILLIDTKWLNKLQSRCITWVVRPKISLWNLWKKMENNF
jgi:hypothetical protein